MPVDEDTIFALATAYPGVSGSGIAIIRISGADAFKLASGIIKPALSSNTAKPGKFMLVDIFSGDILVDHCGLIFFRAPISYTGEDIIELHLHGGAAIIRSVMRELIFLGARPAEPGEFTRRAFLNGKLDLIQAEAIASLVSARGEAASSESARQRSGSLSAKIIQIRSVLRNLLGNMEVVFDYPEEVEDSMETAVILENISSIRDAISKLIRSYDAGKLLKGFRLAIIGKPNVGKSSLLNAFLDEDRAIVTPMPGTTRDVVSGTLELNGIPVECLDTAGIRPVSMITDEAEKEGVLRSWKEVERAHIVLILLDCSSPVDELDCELISETRRRIENTGTICLIIRNKSDLRECLLPPDFSPGEHMKISALTGDGIEILRDKILLALNLKFEQGEILLTQARHFSLITEVHDILDRVHKGIADGIPNDIVATELWGADRTLGLVLGEGITAADMDEIFGGFCVGK